jgi:PAP2 superfamily protein
MNAAWNTTASGTRAAVLKRRTAASIVLLIVVIFETAGPLDASVTSEPRTAREPSAPPGEGEPFPRFPGLGDGLETPYWKRNLFARWIGDQRFLATRWWSQEFRRVEFALPLALSTILAGSSSGGRSDLDERIGRTWRRGLGGSDNRFAMGFSRLGDAGSAIALVGGAYVFSRWSGNERLARSSSLAAEALLDAGLWNVALKRLTRRTRPTGGGQGDFFVDRAPEGQSTDSFPSGHSMGAFAVATVLAEEYRDRRWVPWVAYTTAGLIGGSRVSLERHFPSDVMVGALLGHSIGRMVTTRQWGDAEERGVRIEPVFMPGGEGYGLMYVRRW